MTDEKPKPLPVRERDSIWEVLLTSPEMWFCCNTEDDARVIAQSIVLRYEALEDERFGPDFADELERTAEVLAMNRLGWLSRWFKSRAKLIRNAVS